ncbi:hypothetical protein TIFTF001_044589 [Ficus carica]|uniref:Uncharacterized protein n=1 Tax=Ficus carica TaxID=3494 RepID=A0AA88CR57_FICCA|nr:hypothetical protein TIFTF001_044589 [Ficus carica]
MFTNDNSHGKNKIKFQDRFGPWFELDKAGRPNHSMAARHVVLAERKLTTYVYAVGRYRVGIRAGSCLPVSQSACQRHSHYSRLMDEDRDAALVFYGMQPLIFDGTRQTVSLAGWLYDMETIFRICDIEARLQVLLASRCLARDARRAYPNESMGHYCRRFQDARMPYIPRDLGSPVLQALHLLREGLPPDVRLFVLAPMMGMRLESIINAIMEAEIIARPILPEDPIPAMPLQEIPPQEAEAGADNNDMDHVDFPVDLEDNPEDLPVIIIESDDEEEQEEWEEQ